VFSPESRPLEWFRGRKVTVMGLGLFGGGRGAAEFLCRLGAEVTVTDLRPEAELKSSIEALEAVPGCSPRWVLGRHREEDFAGADLVIPSPAVPREAPLLQLCRARGVPLDTEMNLFFKHCRGRICAITGSNGKTTTLRLLEAMAERRWPGVLAGGNVGRSLLPRVEEIAPGDWVLLEISSFQLEDLASIERRPEIAVITNLSPNHLDRHGSFESYLAAKRQILVPAPGPDPGAAVLNGDEELGRAWAQESSRRVILFGRSPPVGGESRVQVDEEAGAIFHRRGGRREQLFRSRDLRLAGRFNLLNAAAAAAAALEVGVERGAILEAVASFTAVEHRLELAGSFAGVEYYNDSKATTPEATAAALEALERNVILLCGGASKGAGFEVLARAVPGRVRAAVLYGHTAPEISRALEAAGAPVLIHAVSSLEEAVERARDLAVPGDRVLLSPACPSYDQFANFEARGRRFKQLVDRAAKALRRK
jgi:UDP-N-acetylmuramoylalanine--D-glutamate ligase